MPYAVRRARVEDADALGRVHVQVWQEAYAGHMPADYLAALGAGERARDWRLRLEVDDPGAVVVVAHDAAGQLVGFACAGIPRDPEPVASWQLYALNVVASHHGTGVADELIRAVLGDRAASLWVLADNGRARSFYSRYRFEPDGSSMVHEGTGALEVRLVRPGSR